MRSDRFTYRCAACAGPVSKTKVGTSGKAGSYSGLHGWECTNCGRGIKVSRTLK